MTKSATLAPSQAPNENRLSDQDLELLESLQTTIKDNLLSSAKVSAAFATIRDKKLYREDYDTFEEYCKGFWGYSASYCYRLAKVGQVLNDLKQFDGQDVYPVTESHARVFANLKSADRIKLAETVMNEAEDDMLTAEVLERYKKDLFPEKCKTRRASPTTTTKPTTSNQHELRKASHCPMELLVAAKRLLARLQETDFDDDALVDDLQAFIKEAEIRVVMEKMEAKQKK